MLLKFYTTFKGIKTGLQKETYLHIYLKYLTQNNCGDLWQQSADYGYKTANKLSWEVK